jgi:hypothetical protein
MRNTSSVAITEPICLTYTTRCAIRGMVEAESFNRLVGLFARSIISSSPIDAIDSGREKRARDPETAEDGYKRGRYVEQRGIREVEERCEDAGRRCLPQEELEEGEIMDVDTNVDVRYWDRARGSREGVSRFTDPRTGPSRDRYD